MVACRSLTEAQYETFAAELHRARLAKTGRHAAIRSAFEMIEEGMSVLCVTAVEDRLQATPDSRNRTRTLTLTLTSTRRH